MTTLTLTIVADRDCWLHVDVPSGRKASFNLGKVDPARITGKVLIEAVADLGAREAEAARTSERS